MSSLARYANKAVKIPAGRKFKAQPDQQFLSCQDYEPYCFQQSDIDALVSSTFIKTSDSLYSATSKSALNTVLTALNNLDNYWFDREEYTAVDLGKTIRIGLVQGDNDVITMRLVKRTYSVESFGESAVFPTVCYVVTGNKMGIQYNDALYCSILGTTPNNRATKPFLNNGGYEVNIVSVSTFETIVSSLVKISGSLYLARDVSEFDALLDTLDNSDNYSELPSDELSSIDLGKTVRIGLGSENDLLVFRLVKRTGNVATLGEPNNSPNVGYICIASKVNVSRDPEGAAEPGVLGTSPSLLEVKPQFLSNGGYEPYIFTEAGLRSVFADCVKVSDSLYLANSASQLNSVCTTLDTGSGLDNLANDAMSSIDMGKTIRLGVVGGQSDLLTFASTSGVTTGNPGVYTTGYVVVGSKVSKDYSGALYVSVLGTAPRDS